MTYDADIAMILLNRLAADTDSTIDRCLAVLREGDLEFSFSRFSRIAGGRSDGSEAEFIRFSDGSRALRMLPLATGDECTRWVSCPPLTKLPLGRTSDEGQTQ